MIVGIYNTPNHPFWRVFDYPAGTLRKDVVWAEDTTARVCRYEGLGPRLVIEQRKRVLIIKALLWIAIDIPFDESLENAHQRAIETLSQLEAERRAALRQPFNPRGL